nr:serine hydrolase [Paenacidovorax monticola]
MGALPGRSPYAARPQRAWPQRRAARRGARHHHALAMLHTLQAVALGEALSPASRERLQGWMLGNRTGDKRLRAGVPQGWRVGEKTGTGPRGTSNDIGVLWPTGRAPVVLVCYLTGSPGTAEQRDAAIAEVARRVAAWVTA